MNIISEEKFNQLLGKRLTDIRMINKMSVSELAAHIGVSYQQANKYESGTNRMPPKRILMCAQLFEVGVDYFYGTDQEVTKYGYSKTVLMVAEEVCNLPTSGLRNSVFQMAKAINNYSDAEKINEENKRMSA